MFVDRPTDEVIEVSRSIGLDVIQLHGHEDADYIAELKSVTDLPVIKAFAVRNGATADEINNSPADMVLIDSGRGGTGETFDWSFLEGITREYFLAGGLCPENIEAAIRSFSPFAVDVSSGVETNGIKDKKKIDFSIFFSIHYKILVHK